MLFQRILFPTAFSDISKKAADYVLRLKDAGAQEVIILHVIDMGAMLAPASPAFFGAVGTTPALTQDAIDEWRESATEESGRLADRFEEAGLSARAMVEMGDPADVVLRTAAAEDVSLIVLGATGKGHLAELVLGSVSDEVIRKSHRPVLVVKPDGV